jgi:hypothetical protein
MSKLNLERCFKNCIKDHDCFNSIILHYICYLINLYSQFMKKHFILYTKNLILKPYCLSYVEEYHSWFVKD